jgi:hypothetical protein
MTTIKTYRQPAMLVPLDTAHRILATFGITKPSREYERWLKDEGFDIDDFPSVLFKSEYVFVLDWRASLSDELEPIATALEKLGVSAQIHSSDEGDTASISIAERSLSLTYSPNDEHTSWLAVVRSVQSILPANIEFRESCDNGNSDTDVYAVLPRDEWDDLDANAPEVMQSLFRSLRPLSP